MRELQGKLISQLGERHPVCPLITPGAYRNRIASDIDESFNELELFGIIEDGLTWLYDVHQRESRLEQA